MNGKSNQVNRGEIADKIFETTKLLLETEGFEAMNIRNICSKAGIAYSSFYYNFSDKADLLYKYGRRIFEDKLSRTRRPEFAFNGNYAAYIAWLFSVYAEFCEDMGSDYIKYLYETSDADIFYDVCFDSVVIPALEQAYDNHYIRLPRRDLHYIFEDIEPIYKGVIHFWSTKTKKKYSHEMPKKWWQGSGDSASDGEEISLPVLIERIMYRYFRSINSAKFRREFPSQMDADYDLELQE